MDRDELDAALDAALGPVPDALVEGQAEVQDPDALHEALKLRYSAPGLLFGQG